MGQSLLAIAVIVGLLSIVPLSTWAATGRFKDAMHALRGYLPCLGIMLGLAGVIVLADFIGYLLT